MSYMCTEVVNFAPNWLFVRANKKKIRWYVFEP